MNVTKLKSGNRVTIPESITKKFDIHEGSFFSVEAKDNFIKLTPLEPRWTPEELDAIEKIFQKEKNKGVKLKLGKEFSDFVDEITE